jgi:HSP20 family protein
MNNENNSKLFLGLIFLLVVIVIIQGFFLVKLYAKTPDFLSTNTIQAGPQIQVRADPVSKPSLKNSGKIQPRKNTGPNDNEDSFFSEWNKNHWNPLKEVQQMQERMDHLFQNSLQLFRNSPDYKDLLQDGFFCPDIDIKEEADRYIVRLDLPGMDKSNITISLNDRIVTISGIREQNNKTQNNQMLLQERVHGQFQRSFALPGPVDEANMKAEYKEGVLTITVPKAKQEKMKKELKVM